MKGNRNAVEIGQVIASELEDVSKRSGGVSPPPPNANSWKEDCYSRKLFGICISGGGIRSSTFGLGVLQGLAEFELLPKAQYLSTVSGGGYIGSWLQGVLRSKKEPRGFDLLKPQEPGPPTVDPISFLRKYSDYLSPRSGLSLDAIVIPIIWLRNAGLNLAIFFSAFLSVFLVLLVPPALVLFLMFSDGGTSSVIFLLLSAACASLTVYWGGLNLARIAQSEVGSVDPLFAPGQGTRRVGTRITLPLLLAVLFLVLSLLPRNGIPLTRLGQWIGFAALWILMAALQWIGGFIECCAAQATNARGSHPEHGRKCCLDAAWIWILPRFHVLWMSAATAGFIFLLFKGLYRLIDHWKQSPAIGHMNITAWIPPLYLVALTVGVALHVGLMGRDFPDASREWLARLGALSWVAAFTWAAIFAIGLFSPYWIAKLWLWKHTAILAGLTVWIGTTVSSILAGKSGKTGSAAHDEPRFSVSLDVIARYGPFVAVPGFLIVLAFCLQLMLSIHLSGTVSYVPRYFVAYYWDKLPYCLDSWYYPVILLTILCGLFVLLSLRVNINEFSMHHFYKNRLVRCFLGASAASKRKPDSFTGFDPQDDFPLTQLRCNEQGDTVAPFPILNATVTVTVGSELATQERKAVPWFFTPRYSGFCVEDSAAGAAARLRGIPQGAFVKTADILGGGLCLGTAMAVSGAALNPSDGYHFAPQTAFLMTLFDVRLGWWIGNPRDEGTYRRTGPRFAFFCLLRELFGFVDERSAYLNLSDGGNFENLGLYELVRRRCRYVIAVDAEEDPNYTFQALGGAIEKCRVDFGIEIDLDPRSIVPEDGLSSTHCVVGRIYYPEGAEPGWLLYIKASMTGDEPADVERYRREHTGFPQQPTTDQFFLESQFESYRRLGLHIARTTFGVNGGDLSSIFQRLEDRWATPPKLQVSSTAQHATEYVRLIERLADCADLAALDQEVLEQPFPPSPQTFRTASLFRIELLQFMETVFTDLDFSSSHSWNHPGNAGWKSIFKHWAGQQGMKDLWRVQRKSYSKAFQDFLDDLIANSPTRPPSQRV